jgi:acetyltransferase
LPFVTRRQENGMSARNIDAFFGPRSIALIGASQRGNSVGSVIAANLLSAGFDGPILPVNPHAKVIRSVVAYPDAASLPIAPDLAVIATPAETVPGVVRELGARRCRAAIVIGAGFERQAADQQDLRAELTRAADESGIRLIGPNCLGVMAPHSGVNASFAHVKPLSGRIACVMQSGALVASVLEWANSRGIGFSKMVSLGDAVDVDFGDMLNFLASDPQTEAVFLYIEGLSHARKFMTAARALAKLKPVIVMKAGRNPAAAPAVQSHTGALAGADRVYDAAFRRAGIIRVGSLDQMFEAVEILGRPRIACGHRLAIVSNGGGGGIVAADAMMGSDLKLAELSRATNAILDRILPRTWSHANPIDIVGDADGARYDQSLTAVVSDPGVDAVLVINCPTAIASSEQAAEAVVRARARFKGTDADKPVIACWMGASTGTVACKTLAADGIPTFETPEKAIQALKYLREADRRNRTLDDTVRAAASPPGTRTASKLLQAALQKGREWLDEVDAKRLLEAYAIPVAKTVKATSPADVAKAARAFGGPVAVKILSPDIQHKSDVGGVVLALETPEAAETAAAAMLERVSAVCPHARQAGFTVSPMVVRRRGRELIAGLTTDPTFGPVVLFGQGGIAAEQIDDVALALPPISMEIAADLVHETRVSRVLEPFRDWPAADLTAICKTLVSLGRIALEHPEITELDINPLIADEHGVVALDARVRVKDPASAVAPALLCHRDGEHLMKDDRGHEMVVRPLHADDAPALSRFIEGLDPTTIRAGFFETMRRLPPAMLARMTQFEAGKEMAFVAVERRINGDAEAQEDRIYGVGRIVMLPKAGNAEYALNVGPDAMHRGIARMLMSELIAYARQHAVARLCGQELSDSLELIDLARGLGGTITHDSDDPRITCIALSLLPDTAAA